jgi:HK97 family phage prohead protease
MDIQRRGTALPVSVREAETPSISGYASVYNQETVILGLWRERVAPGAFETALAGKDDVRGLFNHDPNIILGRNTAGTLTLSDDDEGLRYDIPVDMNDPDHVRVRAKILRGDVTGSSFGFRIEDEEWDDTPTKKGKLPLVTIRKVELFDVSPVTFPAYPQTSVTARSRGEQLQESVKAFHRRMAETSLRDRLALRIRLELAKAWQG